MTGAATPSSTAIVNVVVTVAPEGRGLPVGVNTSARNAFVAAAALPLKLQMPVPGL